MALRTVTYRIDGPGGATYRNLVVNSVDIQSDEDTEEGLKRLILEELSHRVELIEMSGPNGIEDFPLTPEQEERFRK